MIQVENACGLRGTRVVTNKSTGSEEPGRRRVTPINVGTTSVKAHLPEALSAMIQQSSPDSLAAACRMRRDERHHRIPVGGELRGKNRADDRIIPGILSHE